MKRLGVYVFMVATLVGVVFANPHQVNAQGIDRILDKQTSSTTGVVSKEQLQAKADSLFSNFISQLESKQSNPKQIPSLANASAADVAKYVQQNKALVLSITSGKSTFSGLFSKPATTSTNLYADFTAALNAASSKINSESTSLRHPLIIVEKTAISYQINTLAQERQKELINTGNQDEAGTIQSAVGVQRQEQVRQELSSGKCTSLFSASIIDCIDAGFAWLIKNTLLQIAGFLVWLTANMLNYAIQVSILGFSAWAPDTLYPIWVVIRQIVSLFVVFAGLWLGFMYILGDETKFGKYVGWLVLFALFVNFSYPFSRALVDISNIVSLNVYSAAVGSEVLAGSTNNTAGSLIMNRLGLMGLVGSATEVSSGGQKGFVGDIKSTPGALVALVFVLYAAYIFFIATAIIVTRMAVLVFLIVASPLLLVDSVIPKLGDAAVKMRKMFFEQLIVAPVFMIMLALTLKFMEIFQSGTNGKPGPLSAVSAVDLPGGAASIQTFFSILMMLIMLHIMLKVTKSVAGSAGEMATNFMGKVGGFGLGLATGGAGILARGTIGAGAARMRDSGWMDKMQGSKMGRGMYGLTNSLAQSTYDVRNVDAVSKGMSKAGMGMGAGSTQTYEKKYAQKEAAFVSKYENMTDDKARATYFNKTKNSVSSRFGRAVLGSSDGDKIAEKMANSERAIQGKRNAAIAAFASAKPEDRGALMDHARGDKVLQEKLRTSNQYLAIDSQNDPDAVKKKVDTLMALDDSDMAKKVIDNDPFADISEAYGKEIEKEEASLELMDKNEKVILAGANGVNIQTTKYEVARRKVAEKKSNLKKEIESKRSEVLEEYKKRMNGVTTGAPDIDLTGNDDGGDDRGGGGVDVPPKPSGPGGSDFSHLDQNDHPIPAVNRDASKPGSSEPPNLHTDSFKERRRRAAEAAQGNMGEPAKQAGEPVAA